MRVVERDELQPADHIYSDRDGGILYHHGIYVGKCKVINPENGEEKEIDDAVIHFFGNNKKPTSHQCQKCFPPSKNGGVCISCLDCFLDGNSIYVYKYNVCYWKLLFRPSGTCSVHRSKPPDEVIHKAFALIKENSFGKYHFF
ncbi:hypothetical protein COLO4_14907 [Corchorus olitorius]|uniref:LRAT domain-containing protein n=1 Tax=Corchorus olitorius TaxID=93759 RepID=A0A1R3JQL5_9ROSI|nr:hypothetical protein COLO4_14907 [Corchorus olitorius]